MTVKRWVVRRKSDGLYSFSAHGWTPDITLAGFFQDEHLAHLAVDKIKDVIPVLVTIEEMHPYNQQAHRDQVEAMAKAAPPPDAGGLQEAFVQGALWENPNINGTKATAAATDHYAPQREGGGK